MHFVDTPSSVITPSMPGTNLIVFRDVAEQISGKCLAARLLEAVRKLNNSTDFDSVLNALLAAGEVECALSDCEWHSAESAIAITYAIATLFAGSRDFDRNVLQSLAQKIADFMPPVIRVSPPEGFAYYALHP